MKGADPRNTAGGLNAYSKDVSLGHFQATPREAKEL
jgi:hypothetical protein